MAKLPTFITDIREVQQIQDRWPTILQPVIDLPINNSVILSNIILSSSAVVNHTLGRPLVGWHVVRQRGAAIIYDRQSTNLIPDKTLLLSASSGVSVDLLVF